MAKGIGSYIRKSDKEYFSKIKLCAYCGFEANHIDHIIPPQKGGNSERRNLTKACSSCNGIKSDADIDIFLERLIKHRCNAMKKAFNITRVFRVLKKRGSVLPLTKILELERLRIKHSRFTNAINSVINQKYKHSGERTSIFSI